MLKFDFNVIFTIINILVLYLLAKKFLFDKVNNIIRQRQELVDDEYSVAQQARMEAEADREKYAQALSDAGQQADGLILESREKAQAEYDRIIANAKVEADKEMAKAQSAIAREKEETMRSIKTEVGQLVAMAAGKLLEEEVSDEVGDRLYAEMMAQAGEKQ